MRCQKNIQMISKQIIFVCALHIGYGWKIKSDEVNKIEELKTKCTLLCPFQVSSMTLEFFIEAIHPRIGITHTLSCALKQWRIQNSVIGGGGDQ